MIDRYSREEMKNIWDLNSKFQYYLNVEIAVAEAYADLGTFPKQDVEELKKKAKFNVERIDEIEAEVKHDVIAFLTCVNESLGDLAKYMHVGMTSSDVIDTAFALQIQDSGKIILQDLDETIQSMKDLAKKHKETVCIGRSHGVHAEIMTFGVKICNWIDILERQRNNFVHALDEIRVGQISGPVGTYSNIPPEVEEVTCKKLNLKPARMSTQIIARDYHAYFMQSLALIASVIEQFATEIRHLQRTEVLEVEEGFGEKQKGSSAMPHKKNPVLSENLCGLARVVRANSIVALENIPLWHERDISHSSAERIIFPDSLTLVDFMLNRFNGVVKNLVVHEKNMLKNTNKFGGIVYSQRVLLKLIEKGLTREDAYRLVQRNALDAFENDGDFRINLLNDKDVEKLLTPKEIDAIFDKSDFLKNVDIIYSRVLGI
ncbi:adenylosuccinate lyase [Candidatus Melainabacteria bacterium MEL.A1]|nr:adenylosuccinate lyase [Candidatus Melainabacteria bacterium MEL.A1]CCX79818.1 adenylosuccinate lyase [Clostridium sp. CAG:715]DAA86160.1 MAG TPA: adenylosuccinate lyase [Candidatus Gastranaerophilales bacterium HUM_2]